VVADVEQQLVPVGHQGGAQTVPRRVRLRQAIAAGILHGCGSDHEFACQLKDRRHDRKLLGLSDGVGGEITLKTL
jgi:hypothetical protein